MDEEFAEATVEKIMRVVERINQFYRRARMLIDPAGAIELHWPHKRGPLRVEVETVSYCTGCIEKSTLTASLYDVLIESAPVQSVIRQDQQLPFLHVLPASQDLVGAELELIAIGERETVLRRALAAVQDQYEYILIDCPPSLGLVTLNVLSAADAVVIPIQCEYYALEGISQLLNTIRVVQQNFNPEFQIDGVLLTMFDNRLNLSKQVVAEAREYFGEKVFRTVIPRNVRLAEAPSFGKPILLYDVQSIGAKSYLAVAQELMKRTDAIRGGRSRPVEAS